ncbi:MAG: hypothetical protein A3G93_07200 [Nitrospinae bacterium RIFCSPLOWO2_12_FULL_45_22]|nr:MAG: hypothetical protein A3G93_07200 [Nitrospinae bacterium RIFCSPLOWO2_12_FULL_45_22]
MDTQIMLTGDASRYLGLSYQAVYNCIKRGVLKERRMPNGYRYFLRAELESLRRERMGAKETGDE